VTPKVLLLFAALAAAPSGPTLAHPGHREHVRELSRNLAVRPDVATLLQRGELHQRAGAYDAASADFQAAEHLDPGRPETAFCRAALWIETGDLDRADSLTAALCADHRCREAAWRLRSALLAARGDPAGAASALGRALAASERPRPDDYADWARLCLGAGSDRGGADPERIHDALAALDAGIARLGPVPALHLYAIELERARGHPEGALRRLEAVACGLGEPALVSSRRAVLLEEAGRIPEALAAYTETLTRIASLAPRARSPRLLAIDGEARDALRRLSPFFEEDSDAAP
jgi:tetratricopeptide (TPR) repeat protein